MADLDQALHHVCQQLPDVLTAGPLSFAGHPLAVFMREELPSLVRKAASVEYPHIEVEGSAGRGGWTRTPWVALLDPRETETVQEGIYLVYLFAADGERVYLSLNQGCTGLRDAVGIPSAEEELRRRAQSMRCRLQLDGTRFKARDIALGADDLWRARLYEAGDIASVAYSRLEGMEGCEVDLRPGDAFLLRR